MQGSSIAAQGDRSGGAGLAHMVAARCRDVLAPFLAALDQQVDRRLGCTVAARAAALGAALEPPPGAPLERVGADLAAQRFAPASSRRLANSVHGPRRSADTIEACLPQRTRAVAWAEAARVPPARAVGALDGSVLEKPGISSGAGLRPIRSRNARWLRCP